jgi:hypothetical protein
VFGMGTGVTLAVYSPANRGVLQEIFFLLRVFQETLTTELEHTFELLGRLAEFPLQSERVQASFPEVLARQTGAMQPDFSQRNRLG